MFKSQKAAHHTNAAPYKKGFDGLEDFRPKPPQAPQQNKKLEPKKHK